MTPWGAKGVAAEPESPRADSLRAEIQMLERIMDAIGSRRGHGDARLLRAVESLIADKREQLDADN
jgi:hypothetical protein